MNFDRKGLIGSIIFHGLFFLAFLLFGFITPLPLPVEQGLLINFGDAETGYGKIEPKVNTDQSSKQELSEPKVTKEEVQDKEPVMTQNFEEAPAAVASEKKKKTEPEKKKEKPVVEKKTVEKKIEAPKEEKPVVNRQAMYKGKNTNTDNSGSEGVKGNSGNQGSLSGSENATDHSLGTSSGDGPSFSLAGRNPVSLPVPDIDSQKEGKVVVEVKVDRNGNIVSAVPGVKGSTTLDSYLCNVAKNAALRSKFDSKQDAPYNQIGTITYIFKLK